MQKLAKKMQSSPIDENINDQARACKVDRRNKDYKTVMYIGSFDTNVLG